jgi:hypothetical protein
MRTSRHRLHRLHRLHARLLRQPMSIIRHKLIDFKTGFICVDFSACSRQLNIPPVTS